MNVLPREDMRINNFVPALGNTFRFNFAFQSHQYFGHLEAGYQSRV